MGGFIMLLVICGGLAYLYEKNQLQDIKDLFKRGSQLQFSDLKNYAKNGINNSTTGSTIATTGMASMFLLEHLHNQHHFDNATLEHLESMNLEQLQDFALENNLMHMEDMNQFVIDLHNQFDPYLNPGTDFVVDEGYHGIDHGLDMDHDFGMDHSMDHNMHNF